MARGALGTLGKVLGLQATGGSSATRDGFDKMRQAGAAAHCGGRAPEKSWRLVQPVSAPQSAAPLVLAW